MGKAKGFARPSKFAVRINPPTLVSQIGNAFYQANGQTDETINRVVCHYLLPNEPPLNRATGKNIPIAISFGGMFKKDDLT